jgi:serine protein kinase
MNQLFDHVSKVKDGTRKFENVFQSVARMILSDSVEKITVNGKSTYEFGLFRKGDRHPIGMYDEINSFVSYVKDAAAGGSSREMAFVFIGDPAVGKCLAKGTKVLMYDGTFKKVEDLKVGELLMGSNSEPNKILSLGSGTDEMFRIKQNNGNDYIVNSEHILHLWNTDKKETFNVSVKDFLKLTETKQFRSKGIKGSIDFFEKEISIDPYYLGIWLGDGDSLDTKITNRDKEIIEYLHKYADSLDLSFHKTNSEDRALTHRLGKKIGHGRFNKLKDELKRYNLIKNKHIPDDFLYNSRKNRLKLLAGLLDSDGYKGTTNYYEIQQTNNTLADNIVYLARSLGFRVTNNKKHVVSKVGKYEYDTETNRIIIGGDLYLIPCLVERKRFIKEEIHNPRNPLVCGIQIEAIGLGEYYGFTISGDHLFFLEDFTLTHNTMLVEYICTSYRNFLQQDENLRYTFKFVNLSNLGSYGKIPYIESQTYEDPMILAMNLFSKKSDNIEFLQKNFGFSDSEITTLYKNYRPLGACTSFVLKDMFEHYEDLNTVLDNIKIISVPLVESFGTVTGKYPAKDKITSSSVDLLGEESIQRLLHIADTSNPYRFDLRRGALARVAGGGIHFSDEIFKNKKDLVQVYLGVIQNRVIEIDGYKWPIDTLIIATSNNSEFNRFLSEKEEAPIVDRCRTCYVGHNTNYKIQNSLTNYAIGTETKKTFLNEECHQDPSLLYAASVGVVLTRLPHSDKLTSVEMMKLSAGEIAGEKSVKTLSEVIDTLSQDTDITKRFGQKGIGQRNLGRALQLLVESSETNEGKCMFAYDIFKALERIILDYVTEPNDRAKFLDDLKTAKGLYRERIMTEIFNAYMDEPLAIKKDVMNYVNMIIGIDAENLGQDKMWKYKDPQTGELKAIKIDEKFISSVEDRLSLLTSEKKKTFRTTIRKIYGQKMSTEPDYDFMDNIELVKAVVGVRLNSDIAGAGSLVGALANRTNEENQKLYSRMITTMLDKLGYCKTCAEKTIEYFCTAKDEK